MRIRLRPGAANLLGPVFRQVRVESRPRLTQADVAARLTTLGLPMDRSIISKIENQSRLISDIELFFFMKALHLSPLRLLELLLRKDAASPFYPASAQEEEDFEIQVAESVDPLEDW